MSIQITLRLMNGDQLYYYKGRARGRSKKTKADHLFSVYRIIRNHLSMRENCTCEIKLLTEDGDSINWYQNISFSRDATFYPLVIPCARCAD